MNEKLRALMAKRAETLKAAEEIANKDIEKREEGETERLDELIEESRKLGVEIDRLKALDAEGDSVNSMVPDRPELRMNPDETPTKVPAEAKDKEASQFRSLGHFLQIVAQACQTGAPVDKRLLELRATGSSEGINADGGFLVETDYHAAVMQRVYDQGQVLNRCDRVTISSNSNAVKFNAIDETSRADGSRWGAVQGYWLSEAAAKTASRPKLRQIELNLKKLVCLWYATDELLQDAAAMESVASTAFANELQFMTEDSIVNGTGAGMPLGILNSPALVTVAKETGQLAATVVSANIIKMWSRLWARSQTSSGLAWFVNQDVFPQLYTMGIVVGTGGSPIYQPPGGLSQSPYSTLMGAPVIPIEYCATLGTVGDICLFDMNEYQIAEKGGVQAASSIHVNFTYDETVFRWVFRVDGQPKWNSTLTPYKGTNTQSPFVVLATRA